MSVKEESNMMKIIDRKENPLLNRVELKFSVIHEGKTTPTRSELIETVAKMEPGCKPSLVIVKGVSTRYGRPLTTGVALVYNSRKAMNVEAAYVLEKHGIEKETPEEKAASKAAPAPTSTPAPAVVAAEVSGVEE